MPATFFLNETHELSPAEKAGGGRLPQYVSIPWAQKAARLSDSLVAVRDHVSTSHDPLKEHRYFVVAVPEPTVQKTSRRAKGSGVFSKKTPDPNGTSGWPFVAWVGGLRRGGARAD